MRRTPDETAQQKLETDPPAERNSAPGSKKSARRRMSRATQHAQVELRHERRNATGCGSASTSARRAASVTSTFAGARTCRTTLRHDVCHRTLCCEARRNRCGRAREQQKGQERPQHNARRRGRMRSLEESRGIAHTRRIKDKTMKTLAIEPREIACDPVGHPGQRTRIALS